MSDNKFCLQNHFLIAMPTLMDFNFNEAVVYLCAHSEEGAMGIVINHPILDVQLSEILEQMEIPLSNETVGNQPVLLGGPISPERGFIIHRPNDGKWQATMNTSEELGVTSSQDILCAMAEGRGPRESMVILGYSGWGPGQLEEELAENFWLSVEADPRILFEVPPEKRWQEAAASLGVNMAQMMGGMGHA